jgi:hypothetical protein
MGSGPRGEVWGEARREASRSASWSAASFQRALASMADSLALARAARFVTSAARVVASFSTAAASCSWDTAPPPAASAAGAGDASSSSTDAANTTKWRARPSALMAARTSSGERLSAAPDARAMRRRGAVEPNGAAAEREWRAA